MSMNDVQWGEELVKANNRIAELIQQLDGAEKLITLLEGERDALLSHPELLVDLDAERRGYDRAVANLRDDEGDLVAWFEEQERAITAGEISRRWPLGSYPPRYGYADGLAAIRDIESNE